MLGRKRNTGGLYAIKRINKRFIRQEGKVHQVMREKQILMKISHPFIVNLYWGFQTAHDLYLVMDFCPGGELFFHLHNLGRLSEDQARFYFCEVLLALEYLHSLCIVYRDLKPENVLLDIDGHIRITDFGLSKEFSGHRERTYSFCGSPEYMSPEVITKRGHGREVDFYSLGAFLYEMLTGLPPFYHTNRQENFSRILNGELQIPSYLSRSAGYLLRSLLQKDSTLRMGTLRGTEEVKTHSWLSQVNWDKVYSKEMDPPFRPNTTSSNFDDEYTTKQIDACFYEKSRVYKPCKEDPFHGYCYNYQEIERSAVIATPLRSSNKPPGKYPTINTGVTKSKTFRQTQNGTFIARTSSPSTAAHLNKREKHRSILIQSKNYVTTKKTKDSLRRTPDSRLPNNKPPGSSGGGVLEFQTFSEAPVAENVTTRTRETCV